MHENRTTKHWGEWIKRRANHVGFRNYGDLCAAIGCSRTMLTQWCASSLPPANMRKGFDRKIAAVLRTERVILFGEYQAVAPESAPVADVSEAPDLAPDDLRRKIGALVELLPAEKLRDFYQAGEHILRGEPAAA